MIEQGSDEWRKIRAGRVTASRVQDIIAKTKTGPSASRANYMAELISERLTGLPFEGFQTAAMQRGSELEEEARLAYQVRVDREVNPIGFVQHPSIEMAGASPDGQSGNRIVEFKVPNLATHIDTLRGKSIPARYLTQVQWQMACLPEIEECDWVSYDPRLPERMKLFIRPIKRDVMMIASLESEVREFLKELNATMTELSARYDTPLNILAAG